MRAAPLLSIKEGRTSHRVYSFASSRVVHSVEYISRLFTPAKRNCSTNEREALTVELAVNKFRTYIEEAQVAVTIDHQPLRWLMSLKTPTGRLARWVLLPQPFNLEVQYTPEYSNILAALLSRLPESAIEEEQSETVKDKINLLYMLLIL